MTEIADRFVVAMKGAAWMIGVRKGLEIAVANQSRTGIEENLWRSGLKVKFQIRAIKTGPVLGVGVTVLLSGIGIKAVTQEDLSFKRLLVQVETLARSSHSGEAEDLQAQAFSEAREIISIQATSAVAEENSVNMPEMMEEEA